MAGYSPYGGVDEDSQAGRVPAWGGSSSAGPLVAYGPSSEEATPLLPGKTRREASHWQDRVKLTLCGLFVLVILVFVSGTLYIHFTNCPLYPSTMDTIRRGWESEVAQHEIAQEKWRLEKQEYTMTKEKWKLESEWHERDVARRIREEDERQEWVRKEWAQESERHAREAEEYEEGIVHRVREEQERQERVQKEWAQESERHAREAEEYEKVVARRVREEQERQERVRKERDWEAQEHKKEVARRVHEEEVRRENERQEWRREMENHDQIVEERRKREEEERLKLNMFWGGTEAHKCTTYATREYTARLMNLPTTWEHRVEACQATPLDVHGISYLPKSCEDRGPGVVIGRWEIDQHEPDCASFWLYYKDKESAHPLWSYAGCTSPGSGKRRVEHYLENLPRGSDWREFCATTPARFQGMEFSGAQECFQWNGGTYGHWEIDDVNCQ